MLSFVVYGNNDIKSLSKNISACYLYIDISKLRKFTFELSEVWDESLLGVDLIYT